MFTKEEIGLIIKNARVSAGFTQAQVAKALNRPQQSIANWEVGRSQPDANTLFELFKFLNADLNSAFGFSEQAAAINEKVPMPIKEVMETHVKWLTDLLVAGGYIQSGEDISDRDFVFLSSIINLLDAWLDKH